MSSKHKKVFKAPRAAAEKPISPQPQTSQSSPSKPEHPSKITTVWAAIIIAVVGFVVYFSGLTNGFVQDDQRQIVNNPIMQSVSNIPQLFNGSSGYSGGEDGHLTGVYYRPLMMVFDSIIYAFSGLSPTTYHVVQLLVAILTTLILFLFLRYSFNPVVALSLSLVFLVHPIDSQSVFYNASLQDPLYMLFGLLALWLLLRFSSARSLFLVVACLFLSLLSKETGILFVIMSAVYLFIYNRERFYRFLGLMALPLILYLIIRTHALGLTTNGKIGPIDGLSLWGRLATTPSIMLFYLTTFIFPLHLAHEYYWTYPSPSFVHFFIPLVIDLGFLGLLVYVGLQARRKLTPAYFMTFIFFALWFLLGMALISQVVPLDLTASDAWFYFPIVGLLGMIGIATMIFPLRVPHKAVLALICVVIALLGTRTYTRGHDWSSDYTLAVHDIKYSPNDYNAEFAIARQLTLEHKYDQAKVHAQRAVAIFPSNINYELLGAICIWSSNLNNNTQLLDNALKAYPNDATLWLDKAITESDAHDLADAKVSVSQAYKLAPNQQIEGYYNAIMAGQPLNLNPGN